MKCACAIITYLFNCETGSCKNFSVFIKIQTFCYDTSRGWNVTMTSIAQGNFTMPVKGNTYQ